VEPSKDSVKLQPGEVHVWFARLNRTPDRLARMRTVLDSDETARAARFVMDKHRNRFIAARAMLRDLLAGYLEQPPESIRLVYNEWGKPALAPGFAPLDLRFNLSHSGDLAMYAFALARDVGVDIEMIRADAAGDRIAENYFSPTEVATLRALPPDKQLEGFFNCWTRKEAYVKARGAGLSIDLKSFDVTLTPGDPAKILRTPDSSRWSLSSFKPEQDCIAAIAIEGPPLNIANPRWL
jgi:4'-phosphopantetheinyl transferase